MPRLEQRGSTEIAKRYEFAFINKSKHVVETAVVSALAIVFVSPAPVGPTSFFLV